MDNDEQKNILKDGFYFFYEAGLYGHSYQELYDYLIERGYNIINDGNEEFRFNRWVDNVFLQITGESYLYTYNAIFNSRATKINLNVKDQALNMTKAFPLKKVPMVGDLKLHKDDDIYIISLKVFKTNWWNGLTFAEYVNHIRNTHGIKIEDDNVLIKIYREITNTQIQVHESWHIKHLATTESIFRLLEYQELQESFKQSKEAKGWSLAAIIVSIIGFIASVYFSLKQIHLSEKQLAADFKIDSIQYNEIKGLIKQQNQELIYLQNQQNAIISNTSDAGASKVRNR